MNINELIKVAMLTYKESDDKEEAKKTLDTLKLVKTAFMEYATNKKNAKQFDENDDVSVRITKIDEATQYKLIEDMLKSRVNNIEIYKQAGRDDLVKNEQDEATVLESLLPTKATKEDILDYLNEFYPNGIEQKSMGLVIKEVKEAFERVDGKEVSECVKQKIVS